ncbi:MAG: hypothetical protein AABY11_00180, partial [archaeon]
RVYRRIQSVRRKLRRHGINEQNSKRPSIKTIRLIFQPRPQRNRGLLDKLIPIHGFALRFSSSASIAISAIVRTLRLSSRDHFNSFA